MTMEPPHVTIWRFPEIGVPPNHPVIDRIFPDKPSILGIPHDYGNPFFVQVGSECQVAHERGDTWQEAAHRKYLKLWDKMKPPGG